MSRTSHCELLDGCTKGEGWNTLTPEEMARVKALYASKQEELTG
jgi:hypothetical protein